MALDHRRRAQRRPAGRVRGVHRRRRRLRRRARGVRHRVRLALVRRARGSLLLGAPAEPGRDGRRRGQEPPSTAHLPASWDRYDEWYNFRENPRGDVHVLASLDESSYAPGGGAMGADHPTAWCQDVAGGRSWYTGGGHTQESYSDPAFVQHLLGGIQTAAGAVDAECGATVDSSYEQITLAKGAEKTGEPIALAVLPGGDVLHTSRDGRVWYTTADASTSLAGTIPVYSHDEDGLQGVAVDPSFAENRWVYLYYAPKLSTPAGDAPENGRVLGRSRPSTATTSSRASRSPTRTRSTWRARRRSSRSRPRAARAATRVVRSTSTSRATSTCRPVTTRTRSPRTATRRSTSVRRATRPTTPSVPRATPTTCAASSCASP
ncbi:ThuA domain-containing protein [Oerskovia sp. M15]